MTRTKQATLRALLTLTLAFLPVFSGISSGLHMMLERHVVCSTHGELVHANEHCADSPQALQAEVEPISASLGASDLLELPADEHCLIVLLSRAGFVNWEIRPTNFELPRAGQLLSTERRAPPSLSLEPIVLAPKQSPPA